MSTDREPLAPTLELVERYVAGDLPPVEAERVAAYLATHDPAAVALEALRQSVDFARDSAGDAPERWTQLMDRIRRRELEAGNSVASGRVIGNRALRAGVWIGSVATLIMGIVLLSRGNGGLSTHAVRSYTTHQYQQAVVNLDDGSRMTLAPQTTVRILQYGTAGRTIALESGEAYFEVAHASASPFIVRSGIATTTALGTAFVVRHDAGDTHVRVAVTDGKVRVVTGARPEGVMLAMGQAGDVTDSTTQVSTSDKLAPGIEWASGRIMFHDIPLATVLQIITQWYGYHFRYADQTLGTHSVTLMISTRSSAEALATIEQMLEVNLTVVGDTVTLVPHLPASPRQVPRIRTYDVWTPKREVGR